MSQYLGNALQIGLLAVAFVAAASLAFDAKPEIAIFLRTRAPIWPILAPRYTLTMVASVGAFIAGATIAFVASTILISAPDVGGTIVGSILVAAYLCFAVAITGLVASMIRNVPGTALLTVGSLIVLSLMGLVPHVGPWLPSDLVGGFNILIAGGEFTFWRSIAVTALACTSAVYTSTILMRRREV